MLHLQKSLRKAGTQEKDLTELGIRQSYFLSYSWLRLSDLTAVVRDDVVPLFGR
jgi:hypothetical protein